MIDWKSIANVTAPMPNRDPTLSLGNLVFIGLTARRGAPDPHSRARIVALDRKNLQPLDEWIIPAKYGKSVFSIVDAGGAYD